MSEYKPHIALRILKVFGWTVFSLVILLVAGRFSLKTTPVHNFAMNKAVSVANESLNGKLSIAVIEGDLWNDFTVSGINLVQSDTLVTIDTLRVQYNIWSLMSGTFKASEIKLIGMYATLSEESDSTFDMQHLLKETNEDKPAEPSSFGIDVKEISIQQSSIFIQSRSYLPDSTLRIEELNAVAGLQVFDEISASLSSLSFKAKEGRLPSAISVETAGSYQDKEITLTRLVAETGRSFLRANAFANLRDSTFNAQAETSPFSLQDLQLFLEDEIPTQELQLSIKASGSIDALNIELNAEGEGFDDFVAISDISFSGPPTLKKLGISARNIDAGYFTNDSLDLKIAGFQATVEGLITRDFPTMNATWGFTFYDLRYQHYVFEKFFGSGTIVNEELRSNFQLSDGDEKIIANPYVEQLFGESPIWQIPISVSNLDIGWWLQEPELTGKLSFRSRVAGNGFQLSDEPWTFSLFPSESSKTRPTIVKNIGQPDHVALHVSKDTLTINDQTISNFNVQGSISKSSIKAAGNVQLIDNKIEFETTVNQFLSDIPSYTYTIEASEFDVSEIIGYKDFPTDINLIAVGTGQYFDPDKIQLSSTLNIDSSYVNGATFNALDLETNLDKNVLTISKGELVSEVIEGTFTGRKNLLDPADPENDLAINIQLNNLQPLASLVGARILNASGNISGNITQSSSNELEFIGDLELYEIEYDTLFSAESIQGSSMISIGERYGYNFSLDVLEPAFKGIKLQDLNFNTEGIADQDTLNGRFDLDIKSNDAGQISQSGTYTYNFTLPSADIQWHGFQFQTPARLLTLREPFSLHYENASIQTDTLFLSSDGGTYLDLAIPYADSLTQNVWAKGKDFDFGVVQEILFDERFVDGVLSGEFLLNRDPKSFSGNGALTFSNLSYQGASVDLLGLRFNIADERLTANLSVSTSGEEKINGQLDAPFIAKDPSTLDDSFFGQPVSGHLQINPIQLSDYKSLLRSFQINDTDGILTFEGNLSGTAGKPIMNGSFELKEPTLSGIPIDSAYALFQYDHQQKKITTKAEIEAQGQQAAFINATVPVAIDFRTFSMIMPDEDDQMNINVQTSDFNLSVFNDFLDRKIVSRLQGILNAEINISGTKESLTPNGYIRLDNARISVPIAGIELTKISSEANITKEGLRLKSFKANSGSGSFNAKGTIDLQGITASNMDITAKATRFRLANTSEYNLTIDLDSKLTGNPSQPKASGSITVKNGFVFLQDFGEKSVEDVVLEDNAEPSFSIYDSLAMDMRVIIERNFLIRNRRYLDMEIALTGQLDAQKQSNSSLSIFGSLNAERGYVRPLGKVFTLDEGRFTFSGPINNPDLYLKTSYIPQSTQKQGTPIVMYYIIEGSAQTPSFRFESDPTMEQQDIICYTLFNKPCYALESWQQVISGGGGSSPTDLLVDVLLDEIETLATQQLGIDVVQIDNSRTGNNNATSIKTGWYLNRRTFFAIVNEISGTTPKTLFILEYLISKNLDLIITQGDDDRQGIDLQWQYEY